MVLNHAGLKALAKKLRRPLYTVAVTSNDPYLADVPFRRDGAEWFVKLWRRLGVRPGAYLHRIHYLCVSQKTPILMPNGEEYQNTEKCEAVLDRAALDARYLGLIPSDAIVDRRNPDPILNGGAAAADAVIGIAGGLLERSAPGFTVPRLEVGRPVVPQPYVLEIWIEKTTMDDILLPIAERYGVHVVRGEGELSLTRCVEVVDRAAADGRPVVILYISDFDPAGRSMPVAVSRKIEHELHVRGLDHLDITVQPVVLTPEQCRQYDLPRTPLKASEKRGPKFEARFGAGATELDALEAIHPGELAKILEREIARFHDAELDAAIAETAEEAQAELDAINSRMRRRHAKAIARLRARRKKLLAKIAAFERAAKPVLRKIERDLDADAPDADDYAWPEPDEGDEYADPLFRSTREYLAQIGCYKAFQGKGTTRIATPRSKSAMFTMKCPACGEDFETNRRHTQFCKRETCRAARQKVREQARKAGAATDGLASIGT